LGNYPQNGKGGRANMKNKKDSYMGDVGIIKKLDDIPELKERLIEAFDAKSKDHKAISRYSLLFGGTRFGVNRRTKGQCR
jgi:hypothetical protein